MRKLLIVCSIFVLASILSLLASAGAAPNWKAAMSAATNPLMPTSTTIPHSDLELEIDSTPITTGSSTTSSPTTAPSTTLVEPPEVPPTTLLPSPPLPPPPTEVPTSVPVETTLPTVPETTLPTAVEIPELPENPIDSEVLDKTNAERDNPLAWSNELAAYAESHLTVMIAMYNLHHSDITVLLDRWSVVGENVGVGPTVDSIQAAYMESPTHAENIKHKSYTHFGSASTVNPVDGRIWTVEIFGAR